MILFFATGIQFFVAFPGTIGKVRESFRTGDTDVSELYGLTDLDCLTVERSGTKLRLWHIYMCFFMWLFGTYCLFTVKWLCSVSPDFRHSKFQIGLLHMYLLVLSLPFESMTTDEDLCDNTVLMKFSNVPHFVPEFLVTFAFALFAAMIFFLVVLRREQWNITYQVFRFRENVRNEMVQRTLDRETEESMSSWLHFKKVVFGPIDFFRRIGNCEKVDEDTEREPQLCDEDGNICSDSCCSPCACVLGFGFSAFMTAFLIVIPLLLVINNLGLPLPLSFDIPRPVFAVQIAFRMTNILKITFDIFILLMLPIPTEPGSVEIMNLDVGYSDDTGGLVVTGKDSD